MSRPKAALNLPESNWSKVWDLVRDRLLADATLRAAKFTIEFAEDVDSLRGPETLGQVPVLQVFGTIARWQWHSEQKMTGPLQLTFRAFLPSLDPRDVFNLQMALAKALNSVDATLAHQQALVAAGAETGLVAWPQPLAPVARPEQSKQRYTLVMGSALIDVTTPVLIV